MAAGWPVVGMTGPLCSGTCTVASICARCDVTDPTSAFGCSFVKVLSTVSQPKALSLPQSAYPFLRPGQRFSLRLACTLAMQRFTLCHRHCSVGKMTISLYKESLYAMGCFYCLVFRFRR
jgi:hypothetical protein